MKTRVNKTQIKKMVKEGRSSALAKLNDPELGPLQLLPGTWKNTKKLKGFGFNMMALPFSDAPNGFRVLMNQYDEELTFAVTDKGVPNRGRTPDPDNGSLDQTIVALNYFQKIIQIDSDDFPKTKLHDRFDGKVIHKEPGLWLYMASHETDGMNIARLGTIPHGNSFLAAGRFREERDILINPKEEQLRGFLPSINGVVVGGGENPDEIDLEPIIDPNTGETIIDYFEPYRHYHENPYNGKVNISGFAGFEPVHATRLLDHSLLKVLSKIGKIKRVMRLRVDSTLDHSGTNRFPHSGIVNIPFVVKEADATAMNSTFIIYEVLDSKNGKSRFFMQYAQNVILDFIGRPDGHPGRARWPHISINTMERVSDASEKEMLATLI